MSRRHWSAAHARVQTSAARTLLAILQPMYAEYAGQLKDREGLVDILFVTHDRGPAYVQIDAMKALSEFGRWWR